ncbi:MAG TPA: polysaccharide deacetylase family protein [Bryobacteraceae bacterium]|nr:polysaccharide deacetylase family protein [Bryobacteraceae bacterium]
MISLTFDDGLRCQFEKAVPILASHGIPATFFLTANQEPTHESWYGHRDDWWKIDWREDDIANLRKLINDGHEIGSHSLTHHQQTMQGNPLAEACESKGLIEGWLGTKVTSFCYPYYSSHAYLADAVKNAGYEQARGGPRASYYAVRGDGSFDRFNVDSRQISADDKVSEWVQPGCWHILTFHAIGGQRDGWAPISVGQFAALMTELARCRDGGAVEILPFKCAAACVESLP